ncbi:MAG: LysM peptidoglycan-binding domain-containing protein [Gemmatales bacterium]|nr:LysM peptidoglycan-binding domain-containing protein [Gemmatales bacterium]MDW7995797.1 LysM peptidoglycan-binding domain-containing protein [Gemmatales bacterium]
MTRETKVGLGIAGTVFVLVGGAVAYKLYFLKPRAVEVVETASSTSGTVQVIPTKSASSTAMAPTSPDDKPAPFHAEIHTNPEIPPPALSTAGSDPPARSGAEVPPAPPILIENKPPVSLAEAEKSLDSTQSKADPTVATAEKPLAPPTEHLPPSTLPANREGIPPPPPTSVNLPLPPAPVPESPVGASKPPTSAPNFEAALPPPPPTIGAPLNPPSEAGTTSKPGEASVVSSASASAPPSPGELTKPAVPATNEVGKTPRPSASLPTPTPARGDPSSTAPSTVAAPVTIPPPPPSDAFDRSYAAPPPTASLVTNRPGTSRPEEAIPIVVRPQTQPLANAPPDAYPVKVAPAPVPSEKVEVFEYEVQRYQVRPGDTWELLSRWRYGSERFAQALAAYNRERDPGLARLDVGASIFLPPAEVLQRRYPQLTGQPTAGDAWAVPSGLPPQVNTPPIRPGHSSAPSTAPVSSSSGGPYKFYRIQANDTLWLIAKRTLGSGDRWPEIFRLNRDVIHDVNHLPVGTVLRLPSDAQVDNPSSPR